MQSYSQRSRSGDPLQYLNDFEEESEMKKRAITVLAASSLAMAGLAAPLTFAGEDTRADKSMDQRADETQRAMRDAWLDGKLETALLLNEHLNSFAIDTDVTNTVAVLSGTVESDIDRDLAGEIAKSVDGVTQVENMLRVDKEETRQSQEDSETDANRGFKQAVANATLTARIKSELLINSNTAGMSIDVDSKDGHVVLSGDVDSDQEKELAEKIAENADGAKSVDNRLRVASSS
jgi:osmotically-inducible protein OsmY